MFGSKKVEKYSHQEIFHLLASLETSIVMLNEQIQAKPDDPRYTRMSELRSNAWSQFKQLNGIVFDNRDNLVKGGK